MKPSPRCTKCKKRKTLAKDKARPGGKSSWCVSCMREAAAIRRLTPRGRALTAWNNLIRRAENADGRHPAYVKVKVHTTRAAFVTWAETALSEWMQNNPGKVPSIDRIRDADHYAIANLQIIELGENSRKKECNKNTVAPAGTAWCSGACKAYLQVSNFHKNVTEANGLQPVCKNCAREAKRKWRSRRKLSAAVQERRR